MRKSVHNEIRPYFTECLYFHDNGFLLSTERLSLVFSKRMSGIRIVEKRCVVLLGKCGVGKSTIANQLVGYEPLSSKKPPFDVSERVLQSVTRKVTHKIMRFLKEDVEYEVTVIDTVGLFDTVIKRQDTIFDQIEEYLKDQFTGVNVILFVFRHGRMTPEEKAVFSFIGSRLVKEISPISALAITGCENKTFEARNLIVEEFRNDRTTQGIAKQMTKGIFPVGFPDIKSMKPALQTAYQSQMVEDRDALLDLICQSESLHLTKKLFLDNVKPAIQHQASSGGSGCTLQ